MREEGASERLEKDPLKEQLKIRKVTEDDQGTYKVLDKHGLAISTVQLSVRGEALVQPGRYDQSQLHIFTQSWSCDWQDIQMVKCYMKGKLVAEGIYFLTY